MTNISSIRPMCLGRKFTAAGCTYDFRYMRYDFRRTRAYSHTATPTPSARISRYLGK